MKYLFKGKSLSSSCTLNNRMPYQKTFEKQAYLMIAVPVIGFLVFTLYPMLWAMRYSLFYYDGTISTTRFVGLRNFIVGFSDPDYWGAWLTTLKFAVGKLVLEIPIAMLLALALTNDRIKFKGFFQASFFMPSIISVAIIGVVLCNMLDYFGVINTILVKMHIVSENIEWFASTKTAMLAIILASTWSSYGVNVLYLVSAFNNVPTDVYEAAKIDGASGTTTFFKITLPLIGPVFQTIMLLSINGTLRISDLILVTTKGGPGGSTYAVMPYLIGKFVPGFGATSVNIGYGCALSLITTVIMAGISVCYMKLSNKLNDIY